ncbi:MAG: SUMF1/EgtB/PvdO family nonheme iron enzyme [Rubrivivax sp.]|nr:SUMF1/EgtB/PvdO family nonheme iron enzyme [Rubrivivax sp.]
MARPTRPCCDAKCGNGRFRGPRHEAAEGARRRTRVLRGGSWNNNPDNLRVANRNNNTPDNRNNNNGFRCSEAPRRQARRAGARRTTVRLGERRGACAAASWPAATQGAKRRHVREGW